MGQKRRVANPYWLTSAGELTCLGNGNAVEANTALHSSRKIIPDNANCFDCLVTKQSRRSLL
jgi:hypothetical protein